MFTYSNATPPSSSPDWRSICGEWVLADCGCPLYEFRHIHVPSLCSPRGAKRTNAAMTTRALKTSDIPILRQFAKSSGFEYPRINDPGIETVLVVADGNDRPIAAVAAKRLVEVFCWLNPKAGAALRNEAISAAHPPMIKALKLRGYDCAEAFIPPQLLRRGFGRILTERYGWYRNLVSLGKRLR